jgi:HEAT repeat protein
VDAATIAAINCGRQPLAGWAAEGDGHRLAEVVAEERITPELRMWAMHRFSFLHLHGFRDDQVLIAALVVALSDSNPWMRRDAARELYVARLRSDIREAIPALRQLLADPDDHVRLAAAIALSGVGDQAARQPLVEFAEKAAAVNWRKSAVAALARLHAREGEAGMCRYLTDREDSAWAAGWLEEMGTPSSIAPLKRARRRHPFARRDYTAAIREIERRTAERTT